MKKKDITDFLKMGKVKELSLIFSEGDFIIENEEVKVDIRTYYDAIEKQSIENDELDIEGYNLLLSNFSDEEKNDLQKEFFISCIVKPELFFSLISKIPDFYNDVCRSIEFYDKETRIEKYQEFENSVKVLFSLLIELIDCYKTTNLKEGTLIRLKNYVINQENEAKKILKSCIKNIHYQINRLNEALPPQQSEKPKPEKDSPKTFDELFHNIELVQQSIDVLKEIEPPLIDTDYNYIGKLKGIICVWIDELQRQGIVKQYSDRKIFASLIPQKIKRFSIDESMFGKYHTKAENNYRTDIKTKVSKIKLSQNSQ